MAQIRKLERRKGERWEARIHRGGGHNLSKTFSSHADARIWANDIEAKLDRGETVSRRAERVKFKDACADFLAFYNPTNKSGTITTGEQQLVASVVEDLGKYNVAEISHDVLKNFMAGMLKRRVSEPDKKQTIHPYYNGNVKKTYAESTVRKHYFQIKKILEWHSIREKYSLDKNLFLQQRIPKGWGGKRNRRLEEGELETLLDATDGGYHNRDEWKYLINFALATAARSQEILKAKWSDVNIAGRAWNIPPENVKTSTFRQVPLSKVALKILTEMDKIRSENDNRIFWMWADSSTISQGFRRLTCRAGIENFRFHDLRHEAVSRIFETTELSDSEIMSITGHTNVQTLVGYAHLRASYLADKLDGVKARPRKARK